MIELEVFFFNEETFALEKVGMQTSLDQNDLRWMAFFNIDAIAPHIDGDKEYYAIHASGKEFICNLKYTDVKILLHLDSETKGE